MVVSRWTRFHRHHPVLYTPYILTFFWTVSPLRKRFSENSGNHFICIGHSCTWDLCTTKVLISSRDGHKRRNRQMESRKILDCKKCTFLIRKLTAELFHVMLKMAVCLTKYTTSTRQATKISFITHFCSCTHQWSWELCVAILLTLAVHNR